MHGADSLAPAEDLSDGTRSPSNSRSKQCLPRSAFGFSSQCLTLAFRTSIAGPTALPGNVVRHRLNPIRSATAAASNQSHVELLATLHTKIQKAVMTVEAAHHVLALADRTAGILGK